MAVSIKDIARIAGVSHSTVSRALRGSPLIPAETTRRIRLIAEEHGYSASAIGRSLVSGRTEAIGVVVTSISDPFNGEVVAGLEESANAAGYSVILATSQAQPEREMAVVKSFQARRVDGIVVASSRVGSNYLPMLQKLRIPVVLLNNQHPDEVTHSVSIDDARGAYEATRYLVQLGHSNIGFVGDKFGLHSDFERRKGFLEAMREVGRPVPDKNTVWGDGKVEGGYQAARQLLLKARPSAIFCYNDLSAVGALRAAEMAGLAVPRDLSIVGFDDIEIASLVHPPLTTIRQPRRELGIKSMELLLKLLRGEQAAKAMLLPGELVVRSSTAPPRAYQSISAGKNSATKS
jgi:DNA-binding LacI/PurR family transcriptional regulator